jgi:hypothetical protein
LLALLALLLLLLLALLLNNHGVLHDARPPNDTLSCATVHSA